MTEGSQNSNSAKTRRRRVAFRVAAILLGLLPLLTVEAALRISGWGFVTDSQDPFVGFTDVHPLFVLSDDNQRFEIPKSRQTFFRPESFPASKGPRDFRIFCLGGSTVQGRPYAIETSFTTWLELSLQAADPSRNWEVINCGGVSYASYRLTPVLREALGYEPDLLIIYTGHNEFLEDRTYQSIKQAPRWQVVIHSRLSRLRTYNAARALWLKLGRSTASPSPTEKENLPDEVEALLDYRGGLEQYERDDRWRDGCITHFEFNLRRMITMAEEAAVPVILVNPVSNLKDSPPFKMTHGDDVTEEEKERFDRLWNLAREASTPLAERISLLQSALKIDDRHAGIHYHLGKCYHGDGQYAQAKGAFVRAKDEDICPLRMIEPMHEAVFLVAQDTSATLVDARLLFEQLTADGIPGDEWLVDHVHPSIQGHQRLAARLFDEIVRRGFLKPLDGWTARRDTAYRNNFDSLHPLYYYRGQERLEGLRSWAAGRSKLERPRKPEKSKDDPSNP